jgi:hypothetical protein
MPPCSHHFQLQGSALPHALRNTALPSRPGKPFRPQLLPVVIGVNAVLTPVVFSSTPPESNNRSGGFISRQLKGMQMNKLLAILVSGLFATSVFAQAAAPATPATPATPAAPAAQAAKADAKAPAKVVKAKAKKHKAKAHHHKTAKAKAQTTDAAAAAPAIK